MEETNSAPKLRWNVANREESFVHESQLQGKPKLRRVPNKLGFCQMPAKEGYVQ